MTVDRPGGSGCASSRSATSRCCCSIPIGARSSTARSRTGSARCGTRSPRRPRSRAFWLTITVTAIAVPLNTIFGVLCALALARGRFRGKAMLNAIIDLPFAISPVVVGLALILVYGRGGWLGDLPFQVIFSVPGHRARHDLHLRAVRRARGHARAPGGRRRAGAGRLDARRQPLAGVLAHHAARRSAGASPTASCSRSRAASASSARCPSSRARSRARPRRSRCSSRSASRTSTSPAPTRRRRCWRSSRSATLLAMTLINPRRDDA